MKKNFFAEKLREGGLHAGLEASFVDCVSAVNTAACRSTRGGAKIQQVIAALAQRRE